MWPECVGGDVVVAIKWILLTMQVHDLNDLDFVIMIVTLLCVRLSGIRPQALRQV